jgi:hypothetical protein
MGSAGVRSYYNGSIWQGGERDPSTSESRRRAAGCSADLLGRGGGREDIARRLQSQLTAQACSVVSRAPVSG